MTNNEEYDKLFEHDFDGIREYDNPLPGWWKHLFTASVVFSFFYILYYHVGVGPSIEEKYEMEQTAYIEKQLELLGAIEPTNEYIVEYMNKPQWMQGMAGVFRGNCAQCHANDGGGNIGPNLTDDYWKNVTEPEDIYRVIANGIPGTQMAAWSDRLMDKQIIVLAAYVASLRGTTPAAPKEPEGSEIPPWPTLEEVKTSTGADEGDGSAMNTAGTDTAPGT